LLFSLGIYVIIEDFHLLLKILIRPFEFSNQKFLSSDWKEDLILGLSFI